MPSQRAEDNSGGNTSDGEEETPAKRIKLEPIEIKAEHDAVTNHREAMKKLKSQEEAILTDDNGNPYYLLKSASQKGNNLILDNEGFSYIVKKMSYKRKDLFTQCPVLDP